MGASAVLTVDISLSKVVGIFRPACFLAGPLASKLGKVWLLIVFLMILRLELILLRGRESIVVIRIVLRTFSTTFGIGFGVRATSKPRQQLRKVKE